MNLENRFDQTFVAKDNNLKYSFELKDVKTILNKRKGERSLFIGDYSLNPYMGCSFDCSYCYVNGSKYANKTSSLIVKSNAYELVKAQLKNKAKHGERAIINLGTATDCYMSIERELGLTRDILKIINRFRFSVHIITKSDLILRDIDILKKIQKSAILPGDVKCEDNTIKSIITFSFSTTDDEIAKIFEYNAPRPSKRLKIVDKLKKEGFLVGVALMPILPFISDDEDCLNKIFSDFKKHDVDHVLHGSLTLFGDKNTHSKVRYLNLLKENYPELYDKTSKIFGEKNYLSKNYQEKLNKRVHKIANDFSIKTSIISQYFKKDII
ncbi:MAG: radical SAM protein [Methanobrevibacter sp.]|jgi:DNA repair photolyase|nr:radical SAM protein [Candidatus Methanovirga basalitermitum]